MFGENPVEILINQTPYNVAFIGNTSSKSINLSPDYGYIVRVEPSGISDAANAPDAGLVGIMKWMDKNPFGTFAYATLIGLILLVIKRR